MRVTTAQDFDIAIVEGIEPAKATTQQAKQLQSLLAEDAFFPLRRRSVGPSS